MENLSFKHHYTIDIENRCHIKTSWTIHHNNMVIKKTTAALLVYKGELSSILSADVPTSLLSFYLFQWQSSSNEFICWMKILTIWLAEGQANVNYKNKWSIKLIFQIFYQYRYQKFSSYTIDFRLINIFIFVEKERK